MTLNHTYKFDYGNYTVYQSKCPSRNSNCPHQHVVQPVGQYTINICYQVVCTILAQTRIRTFLHELLQHTRCLNVHVFFSDGHVQLFDDGRGLVGD